mmetsp:Transcript_108597/g.188606  ORF Transcript_108597/g.188606 Transcript_108597/m.188606 type:complete len:772 (+) Transcript_108597:81-2396(+)
MEKATEGEEVKKDDEKQRFMVHFSCIYAEVLVEGNPDAMVDASAAAAWNAAAAEAIKLSRERAKTPKYFNGEQPSRDLIEKIDAVGSGDSSPIDDLAKFLYGNFFHLCMALKPRPGEPATAKDSNFDPAIVERFFQKMSAAALSESLEALGRVLDKVLEEGVDELVSSPAKLRALLVALAHPALADPDSEPFEVLKKLMAVIKLCHRDKGALEILVNWYAQMPLEVLERHLAQLQQFLVVSLLMAQAQVESGSTHSLEAVMEIAKTGDLARHTRSALRLMDIYWRANEYRIERANSWRTRWKAKKLLELGQTLEDELARGLPVNLFHNDAINEFESLLKHDLKEVLEMQHQGKFFGNTEDDQRNDFGVMEFPFVLTPVSKVRMLNIESLLMQREEVRTAMAYQILRGRMATNPFLVLKVRRSAVIQDALQQLATLGSQQFKKPLKIVFDGEEGVDEGGVQKEFFQLLIEELYNEDFGMFERVEESRNFWFNKNSFEANLQFELFGIVLGLAIYNQVILDIKFPRALYKKLMGGSRVELGLSDLMDFQPSLAQGLINMLEFQPEPDMQFEDVFGPLRFVAQYECYGSMVEAELSEGGKEMPVTFENRMEYIQRYCDWIFTNAVQPQYKAFRKGFDQCIGDTLFRKLFRADELELVICGSVELDFEALQKVSQYQDGYTESSPVMIWFWEVVHSLSPEDKRNFLQFCTGCDRAPVGGLGRLPFIISRAGPDSSMLPWVHTCFNHILVPEYSDKEKLDRLLRLAIQHSHGFGLM